MIYFAHQGMK